MHGSSTRADRISDNSFGCPEIDGKGASKLSKGRPSCPVPISRLAGHVGGIVADLILAGSQRVGREFGLGARQVALRSARKIPGGEPALARPFRTAHVAPLTAGRQPRTSRQDTPAEPPMSNVAFAILRSKAVAAGFAFDCAVRESARRQFPVSLALGLLVIALAAPGAVRPGRESPGDRACSSSSHGADLRAVARGAAACAREGGGSHRLRSEFSS